jgi:hypothetical protein
VTPPAKSRELRFRQSSADALIRLIIVELSLADLSNGVGAPADGAVRFYRAWALIAAAVAHAFKHEIASGSAGTSFLTLR